MLVLLGPFHRHKQEPIVLAAPLKDFFYLLYLRVFPSVGGEDKAKDRGRDKARDKA